MKTFLRACSLALLLIAVACPVSCQGIASLVDLCGARIRVIVKSGLSGVGSETVSGHSRNRPSGEAHYPRTAEASIKRAIYGWANWVLDCSSVHFPCS